MFTKTAWPFSPASVAADLQNDAAAAKARGDAWRAHGLSRAAKNVQSGQDWTRRGGAVLRGAGHVAEGAGGASNAVLRPAGALGRLAMRGASGVANYLGDSPRLAKPLAGAALAAPILMSGAADRHQTATANILRMREDPSRMVEERDVMASLDAFLEKKASQGGPYSWQNTAAGGLADGLGKGVGQGLAEGLLGGLGRLFGGVGGVLFDNPKKKAVLEKVLREDPVISDALKRNPANGEHLLDAYKTLSRFAPSLALDTNAVRSFLREVILGGGHVNYATIKNLVETEKSLSAPRGRY